MARILDLNSVQGSIMDLTLSDEKRTVVHLDFPTEELVQELEAMLPKLTAMEKGDRAAVNQIYELAASLINCNLDYFETSGEKLRKHYGMTVVSAIKFFSAYMTFLEELQNEKN